MDAGGVVYPVAPGTTTISYTITLAGCGSAFASTVVTVVASPAPITGPTTICMDAAPSGVHPDTITLKMQRLAVYGYHMIRL